MLHKPIAIMILSIFVAGFLMLGLLAAYANAQENDTTGIAASSQESNNEQTCPDGSIPDASGNCATSPPPPAGASQESNNTNFVNTILEIHYRERAEFGVPPLVWSDTLTTGAMTWAEHLATTGEWRHATEAEKGGSQGENIHLGQEPTADAFKGWLAEKTNYHGQTVTVNIAGLIGHYAQMVSKTLTEIGCGTADSGDKHYLVCRYSP